MKYLMTAKTLLNIRNPILFLHIAWFKWVRKYISVKKQSEYICNMARINQQNCKTLKDDIKCTIIEQSRLVISVRI